MTSNMEPTVALPDASSSRPERVHPEFCVCHLLFFPCFSIQYVGLAYMLLTCTCMCHAAWIFLPLPLLGGVAGMLPYGIYLCEIPYGIYLCEIPHFIYSFSCQRAFGSLSLFVRFAFIILLL